jgi:hypothetical protein
LVPVCTKATSSWLGVSLAFPVSFDNCSVVQVRWRS